MQAGGAAELVRLLCQHLRDFGRDGDPHQRARVGEAVAALETATLWVTRAAWHMARDSLSPEAKVAYVNLARGAVERALLEILLHAQRSVGLMASCGRTRWSPWRAILRPICGSRHRIRPCGGVPPLLDQKEAAW